MTGCCAPASEKQSVTYWEFFWWYWNRYQKKLVPEKSLGTGIGKIWYRS